jgi:hypothetical protein
MTITTTISRALSFSWLGSVVSGNMRLLLVVVMLVGASLAQSLTPVMLRLHANNYQTMTMSQAMEASISQMYPDLGNRYIQTAFSIESSQDRINFLNTLEAISIDFMIGQRPTPSGSTPPSPYDFTTLTPSMLGANLKFIVSFYDDANNQPPCYICPNNVVVLDANTGRSSVAMDAATNASSITTVGNMGWGTVYRLSVILLNRSGSVSFCDVQVCAACLVMNVNQIPASLLSNVLVKTRRLWVVLIGVLPNQNTAQQMQYTFRLPVSDDQAGALSLQLNDPYHLINNSWTTWQQGSAIASFQYPGFTNPQVGLQAAGLVNRVQVMGFPPSPQPPASLGPSTTTPFPVSSSLVPVPSPSALVFQNGSNGTNSSEPIGPGGDTLPGGTLAWIIAGSVLGGLILIVLCVIVALVLRRKIKRWRYGRLRGGLAGQRDREVDEEYRFTPSSSENLEMRMTSLAESTPRVGGQPLPAYAPPAALGKTFSLRDFANMLFSIDPEDPTRPQTITELMEQNTADSSVYLSSGSDDEDAQAGAAAAAPRIPVSAPTTAQEEAKEKLV